MSKYRYHQYTVMHKTRVVLLVPVVALLFLLWVVFLDLPATVFEGARHFWRLFKGRCRSRFNQSLEHAWMILTNRRRATALERRHPTQGDNHD